MKRLFSSLMFIAVLASCKKEEAVVNKTYKIEYRIIATPLSNTSLGGTISYISPLSPTASGSLGSNGWTATEDSWLLRTGDKVGFSANITNIASYQASILVDGGVRAVQSGSQTFPSNTTINLSYTIE